MRNRICDPLKRFSTEILKYGACLERSHRSGTTLGLVCKYIIEQIKISMQSVCSFVGQSVTPSV